MPDSGTQPSISSPTDFRAATEAKDAGFAAGVSAFLTNSPQVFLTAGISWE